ncbi:MAG: exosortase/archaeosortase family protein [Candidatus Bathyarchaeia archaeon]
MMVVRLGSKTKTLFSKLKEDLPSILAFLLTVSLILTVYWRDLEILVNEALNTEAVSHIFFAPFLAGLLFYWKRDFFKASVALSSLKKQSKTIFVDSLIGFSLCLIAFLIYWYGSYTFYPLEYHIISLPIFTLGTVLVLFNVKTLQALLIPALFLIFLVPIPVEITYILGGYLAEVNTQTSYMLLKTLGIPVRLSTEYGPPTLILSTSAGQPSAFTIDVPCSGIYTLTVFVMFAVFLAVTAKTSIPKKLLIFTLGFMIFEALNIIRITTIISAAYLYGEETAMLIFHTLAGVILTFTGMFITLIISEKFLKINFFNKKDETPSCRKCVEHSLKMKGFCLNCGKLFNLPKWKPSKNFWAKLVLLFSVCSLISLSINAPVFAISQETLEVTSTWEAVADILPQIPNYSLTFLYRDVKYERIAKQDASLVYAYYPKNVSESALVYVLIGVADSISNLHSWEVCLISMQTAQGRYPLVTVIDSRDVQIQSGGYPIIARYLVFKNQQNYTQVTLYWYTKATFKTGITVQQKYVRINLVILTAHASKYLEYEDQLLGIGETVSAYWEPLKTQSLISLSIPAQQALLTFLIAFVIFAKTTQRAAEWRKRTNNLKIFNNYASKTDRLLLETVSELGMKGKVVNAMSINAALKMKVGKTLKFERLIEKLNRLEEYGLIQKTLTTSNDKPVLAWKSLV